MAGLLGDGVLRLRLQAHPQRRGPDFREARGQWQTSPARIGPDQTQSSTALKKTVCSGTTARAATTHAAMSIQLIMWPPCMTPSVFS